MREEKPTVQTQEVIEKKIWKTLLLEINFVALILLETTS